MNNKKITIGIIGGQGAMGSWFAEFFIQQGCSVLVSGAKTELTNQQLASKSDVIIFSVPIEKTEQIIKETIPFVKNGTLLTDLTSIKDVPVKAMLKAPKGVEVIGMHNIFGPTVKSVKNQTIVLCPARGDKWLPWLQNIFIKNGAKVKITTAVKHDQIMGVVQGLTHFSAISTGLALKELGIDIEESLSYVSPVYHLRMDEVGRILAQNPQVYASIAIQNKYSQKSAKAYLKVCQKLLKTISNQDKDSFIKYFNQASSHLGEFPKKALEETNYLIEKLGKMENDQSCQNLIKKLSKLFKQNNRFIKKFEIQPSDLLSELLNTRLLLTPSVAGYKYMNNIWQIKQPKREAEILEKFLKKIENKKISESELLIKLVKKNLSLSKKIQKEILLNLKNGVVDIGDIKQVELEKIRYFLDQIDDCFCEELSKLPKTEQKDRLKILIS